MLWIHGPGIPWYPQEEVIHLYHKEGCYPSIVLWTVSQPARQTASTPTSQHNSQSGTVCCPNLTAINKDRQFCLLRHLYWVSTKTKPFPVRLMASWLCSLVPRPFLLWYVARSEGQGQGKHLHCRSFHRGSQEPNPASPLTIPEVWPACLNS